MRINEKGVERGVKWGQIAKLNINKNIYLIFI